MSESPLPPTPAALRHRREAVIAQLCDHFARDHLEAEELEELIDRAHNAQTLVALDSLLEGLPEIQPESATMAVARNHTPSDQHQVVVAVMGGVERKGSWAPAPNVYVVACMGGTLLDFRDARLAEGVTNVMVLALMGGVEIIVPPDLRVESNGIGIMGGFEQGGSHPPGPVDGPVVRVSGAAIMGGVEIKVRPRKERLTNGGSP
jgi:hypothetical protein